jgi:hypothetical protein
MEKNVMHNFGSELKRALNFSIAPPFTKPGQMYHGVCRTVITPRAVADRCLFRRKQFMQFCSVVVPSHGSCLKVGLLELAMGSSSSGFEFVSSSEARIERFSFCDFVVFAGRAM